MSDYISKGAVISSCGKYRYRLWREWRSGGQWDMWTEDDGSPALDGADQQLGEPLSCVFVMLNPSTADGNDDDQTIRKCVKFAKAFGFDRLEVVNLFAWRATSPDDMKAVSPAQNPEGLDNSAAFSDALEKAGLIVCAWGNHGAHLNQSETALGWIDTHNDRDAPIVALHVTGEGQPGHPLYLPDNSKPIPFGETP